MKPVLSIIAGLSLFAVSQVNAAPTPEKMNGLLTNSPFGSAKSNTSGGNAGGEPFEFRAVLEENGSKFFSIYDATTRRSNWVELNDPVNGFSVKEYNATKESITVDYQGKPLTLTIKRAPAVAQSMQQPLPNPNGVAMPGVNPTMQPVPTTADQQRIQQIQEEIRRRRALRSQANVSGNSGVHPNNGAQPNYGNGPQPIPSTNSTGPMPTPTPSHSTGPQLLPPKP